MSKPTEMYYIKLLTFSLFLISCSSKVNLDSVKEVLQENPVKEPKRTAPQKVAPIVVANVGGYKLTFSESSKHEFENSKGSSDILLNEKQCIEKGMISLFAKKELNLRLLNGNYFTLKKDTDDEQFYGYTFIHYDKNRKIYVVWENWLEAGYPVMINGLNGEVTKIFGKSFRTNKNKNLTANFADDIEAGWTPNGIQILETQNGCFKPIFEFDPTFLINEKWGPIDLKWQNDSTLLIVCIMNDGVGSYSTGFKKLEFVKQ